MQWKLLSHVEGKFTHFVAMERGNKRRYWSVDSPREPLEDIRVSETSSMYIRSD